MRRGTRVGQAYVAVTADGSGVNEEIVDSVDEAGPGVDKAAKKQGKRYGKEFGKNVDVDAMMDRLAKKLGQHMSRQAKNDAKSYASIFEKSMSRVSRRIGDRIGKTLSEGMFDQLEETFARMVDTLDARMAQVSGNGGRGGGGGPRPPAPGGNAFPLPEFDDRRWAEALRLNQQFHKDRLRMLTTAHKMNVRYDGERIKMLADAYKMNAKFDSDREAAERKYMSMLSGAYAMNAKFDEERLKSIRQRHDLEMRSLRTYGDGVGRIFGKGSRNNVLNLLGSSVANILNMTNRLTRFGGGFAKGFKDAADNASILQRVMSGFSGGGAASGLSTSFSSLAASAPAAAAGILAVVATMSIMVSVAGALTAILTALTATIVSGLTGGLLVLGGAMTAVVAAGGLLTAAFMSMDDAQKKLLKSTFRPLREEMVGIGQIMIRDMIPSFKLWSQNLQEALFLAAPVAQVMGRSFGRAGEILTKSLSGPGFQNLATMLGIYLPGIVNNLSRAFGNFLNGVTGTFSALMPLVDQFARYLADVTGRWSRWANSAQGQNSIVDFANRAVASLKSLWNFTREFTGFLIDVLFSPAAQNAGNGFFDSLAKSFEGFRSKISDGSLERWFQDAKTLAGDLKVMVKGLADTFSALYNSGVLAATGDALRGIGKAASFVSGFLGPLVDLIGRVAPYSINLIIWPLKVLQTSFDNVGRMARWALDRISEFGSTVFNIPMLGPLRALIGVIGTVASEAARAIGVLDKLARMNRSSGMKKFDPSKLSGSTKPFDGLDLTSPTLAGQSTITIPDLITSGSGALSGTTSGSSGTKPYVNPYAGMADAILAGGPSTADKIKKAMREVLKLVVKGLKEAMSADNLSDARSSLNSLVKGMRDMGKDLVRTARQAVQSAASTLSSAGSSKAAAKALAALKKAQKDLGKALKSQDKIQKQAKIINAQKVTSSTNVNNLLKGLKVQNATLADYAVARSKVAKQLEEANKELTNRIEERDAFQKAVSDSVKSFASLMSAQAQTINGVAQAITAADITSNLSNKLGEIKKFQENLRILLASGLSEEAYRQLVDAGVAEGGAFAQALVDGGVGSVQEVNDLLGQITGVADSLGIETSKRLYQAGVDAAQGLVDGLNSLSDQLDKAAATLGTKIAKSIKKALGIKSPSQVMIDAMGDVGDGIEEGLDKQSAKVGSAAASLAGKISVSPEVAAYEAKMRIESQGVSGNDPRSIDLSGLTVITPTEDPVAVAKETITEIVGRI